MIHHFNTDIAKECGVNAAVLFDNIAHWIAFNEANGKNLINGKYWTYNSRKAFQILFPYLSEKQVRTAIDKLRDSGLVETAYHSEDPFDRTLWFALTDKGYLFSDSHDTPNKGENGLAQKGQCMLAQKGQSSHIINNHIINSEDSLEDNKLSSRSSSFVPHPSNEKCETPAESQKIFITFPLIGKKTVDIPESWCDEMQTLYGNAVNVRAEIKLAIAWCKTNEYKKDWKKFLNNWFSTCLKKGGSSSPYIPEENAETNSPCASSSLKSKEEEEARVARAKKLTSQVKARWAKQQEELEKEWNSRRIEG